MSFRDKAHAFLTKKPVIVTAVSLMVFLTFLVPDAEFFFGALYVLLLLWSSRWNWSVIKLYRPSSWQKVVFNAFLYSVGTYLLIDILAQPLVEIITNESTDLSNFESLKGNWIQYLIYTILIWTIAAFGEEFVFRGFLMKQMATIFGDTKKSAWLALLITSFIFGYGHDYQGISGMITTGIIGAFFGLVYMRGKDGMITAILFHGILDMIGLTVIFFDKERVTVDLIKGLLQQVI